MHAARQQVTIAGAESVFGFGYWSGQDVQVQFRPAPANHGLVFVREDLVPSVAIPATIDQRREMPLRTTLQAGDAHVEMVEHVLAALAGLGITNCEIAVTAAEMPGCDGSSQAFVEALLSAGLMTQSAPVQPLFVAAPIRIGDDDSWIEARPAPEGGLSIEYQLDYGTDGPLGQQRVQYEISTETFVRELAPSRTFARLEEAEALKAIGRGLRVTPRDLLVFDDDGPIDNELRFADECARHKLLDIVGDLALAGAPVVGRITAYRSGHRFNSELVRQILEQQASQPRLRTA